MNASAYDPRNGKVLVTGASSGIGAAIVRLLTDNDYDVVALARRKDRLAELAAETGCTTASLDVRELDAVEAFVRDLNPSVIVSNAGTAHGIAGLTAASQQDIRTALDTNVLAPIHIVRAAIPLMTAAGGGHVISIGSISGLYPIVSALYGASKGAMHMVMQNLRMELRGTGIRVSEIAPGRTETELYDAANLDDDARERMSISGVSLLSPDDVASTVLFALGAPLHVNIGLIELTPTEQALGGATFTPFPK